MHNMYALARNTWKFQSRDKRKTKTQHVEFDCFAPDTAEEIFHALELLEIWTGRAALRNRGEAGGSDGGGDGAALAALGRELLAGPPHQTSGLEILGENLENSRRATLILKPRQAYHAYRQMLAHYAMTNLLAYLRARPKATLSSMCEELAGPRVREWVNLGGQLAPAVEVDRILSDIKSGRLDSWPEVHQAYDRLWEVYPLAKQRHAFATLLELLRAARLTPELWTAALDEAARTQDYVCQQVYLSRKKDYDAPLRRITFRNAAEMQAVIGTPEGNSFVAQVRRETAAFQEFVEAVKQRG
jgi:hypothetical protein